MTRSRSLLLSLLWLVPCAAVALVGCYSTSSVPCEGVEGGFCKQGYVCTKKKPFVCILEGDLCGNDELDEGEQCDDGNRKNGDNCSADCKSTLTCGNGIIDEDSKLKLNEECDPGEDDPSVVATSNRARASGDSAACNVDCTRALCGDGKINSVRDETCDPHQDDPEIGPSTSSREAAEDSQNCNKDCTIAACGDGYRNRKFLISDLGSGEEKPEECDPREFDESITGTDNLRLASGDAEECDRDCTKPSCGDGHTNPKFLVVDKGTGDPVGEECDSGKGDADDCDVDCTVAACGDGYVNKKHKIKNLGIDDAAQTGFETCDPGFNNPDIRPGASRREASGDTPTCDRDCTERACGDGYLSDARDMKGILIEECEPGQDLPDGAKCENCKLLLCGNGRKDDNEACDFSVPGTKGCSPRCELESCGNGVLDPGDPCDDEVIGDGHGDPTVSANQNNCIAFSSTQCLINRCGDGFLDLEQDPDDPADKLEQCDDGPLGSQSATGESALCNSDCTVSACGDGKTNASFVVQLVERVDGTVDIAKRGDELMGKQCDPGSVDSSLTVGIDPSMASGDAASCDRDCSIAECGDLYTNTVRGEQCDDALGQNNRKPFTAICDDDCTWALCGDGQVNDKHRIPHLGDTGTLHGEECEPAGASPVGTDGKLASKETAACNKDCSIPRCGDGYVNAAFPVNGTATVFETCDDIFLPLGTAKTNTSVCNADCTAARCGDGYFNDQFEECEKAIDTKCTDQCKRSICGNASIDPGEQCEARGADTDDCNGRAGDPGDNQLALCQWSRCGDGFVNAQHRIEFSGDRDFNLESGGEQCDPASGTIPDENVAHANHRGRKALFPTADCDNDCSFVICGDGYENEVAGEAPGCDPAVQNPKTNLADSGRTLSPDCDSDCTAPACGDGIVNTQAGEGAGCDTGALKPLDPTGSIPETALCNVDCTAAQCGDGKINATAGEDCDPGPGKTTSDPHKASSGTASCTDTCTSI